MSGAMESSRRQVLSSVLAAAALVQADLPASAKPPSEVAAQDDTSIVSASGQVRLQRLTKAHFSAVHPI